ncbi:antimicrobial peptide NK-lysin-like isoform X1 [Ornithorhynchus anatinus]|uniref:antimicrobial peptide NK-lysin-like isoform X1 n=1 Tax=Ornithorhynchus anatinus TaxID=9258 RepID=UPI0010A90994|nr:antimicrobial peptide NK-lysin-like isoform X1 [Ornithorhynchus anatinus]
MAAFLLLLSLTLLAGPAWAGTGLIPKDHKQEPALWHQQHHQDSRLTGDLLDRKVSPRFICSTCQVIMTKLKELVGDNSDDMNEIKKAEKQVCSSVSFYLRWACEKLIKKFFLPIARDFLSGKNPRQVCEDIKICKPKKGPEGHGSEDGSGHREPRLLTLAQIQHQDAGEKILESESALEKRTLEEEWSQPAKRSLRRY